jgi:iron complex outermembrane receptor protein
MEVFVQTDFIHDTKMIKTLKNCEKLLNCLFSMKMMAILSRILWLSIWLMAAIGHLSAQQLNGLAVDRINAEPVTFASIRVNDVNTAIADSLGHFSITLPAGRSVISISKVGYVTYFQTINLSEDDHISMRFLLERYTNELQRVVISSSKQEKALAREAVSIVSIQPYLIANTNSNTLSDVLNRVPGISVVDGQAIIRGGVGWSYNVGSRVMVLLDDMPLMGPDAGDV